METAIMTKRINKGLEDKGSDVSKYNLYYITPRRGGITIVKTKGMVLTDMGKRVGRNKKGNYVIKAPPEGYVHFDLKDPRLKHPFHAVSLAIGPGRLVQ